MKKVILLGFCLLFMCACSLVNDDLENATIYTTTYPITYLTKYLYGDHGNISSIYPENADLNEYKLTEKQISKYAKGDLFVYNGLSNEKNYAKSLLNYNKNLLIIDVSYGLTINNDSSELWLSPNNYLMLAKNIKDNLNNYLTSKYIIEDVSEKYESLALKLSLMDADLRSIGKEATEKNNNILVITSSAYAYLDNYGFTTIVLNDNNLNSIKNNFKIKKYGALINEYDNNETINDLVKNYNAVKIDLSKMETIVDSEDYLSIMNAFIDNLRNTLLG